MVSTEQLLYNNIHIGARYNKFLKWNGNYLYGLRKGYLIFNLDQTLYFFRKVNLFAKEILWLKGYILVSFAGSQDKKYCLTKINKMRYLTYFARKWYGGLLTNFKHFRNRRLSNQNFTMQRKLPDIVFSIVLDNHSYLLNETSKLLIPSFSVTNAQEKGLNYDYIFPGNNKSIFSMNFYINLLLYFFAMKRTERKINL